MSGRTRTGHPEGRPDATSTKGAVNTEDTPRGTTVEVIGRRPTPNVGRDVVHQLARDMGRPVKELLVMDRTNDPFNCGTPADVRDGEWFCSMWQRFDVPAGAHLRRVHYAILGRTEMPDGRPYENTETCWTYLLKASTKARTLGLIDARWLVDRRNAEPVLLWEPRPTPEPTVTWDPPDWTIPAPTIPTPTLLEPEFDLEGYDLDAGDHPVHVEVMIEKSTMNDVLLPVCERLGVNLIAGSGFTSHTRLVELLERSRHGRPVRILCLSDFDPAGTAMPVSAARYLEYLVTNDADGADMAMEPLVLTAEQCATYELPRIPIKASDNRRGRFEERHGEGATELDALEALHPGELARIVTDAVMAYRDPTHWSRLVDAEEDAETVTADVQHAALGDLLDELADVSHAAHVAHQRLTDDIGPDIEAYENTVEPLRQRLAEMADQYVTMTEDLEVDLPTRPAPVAVGLEHDGDWLYRSDRTYLRQRDAYRQVGR